MTIRQFEGISPLIGEGVFIDHSAVVLGDVQIGDDSSVWPCTVIRGDVNRIRIGRATNIQDNSVLHVTHDGPYSPGGKDLVVGDDVTIGHRVILHACDIGDRCLIGMGAIIMDKAVLEPDVFLAAGTLVSPGKVLESGYLYRGSPAKQVRQLTDDEMANLKYSAEHYVRVKNRHMEKTE